MARGAQRSSTGGSYGWQISAIRVVIKKSHIVHARAVDVEALPDGTLEPCRKGTSALTDVLPSTRGNYSEADAADSLSLCRTRDTVDICSAWGADGGCDCAYHDSPRGLTSSGTD